MEIRPTILSRLIIGSLGGRSYGLVERLEGGRRVKRWMILHAWPRGDFFENTRASERVKGTGRERNETNWGKIMLETSIGKKYDHMKVGVVLNKLFRRPRFVNSSRMTECRI